MIFLPYHGFFSPIPPTRARRALFPAALAIPAPGERTISNAAVACDG